MEVVTAKTSAAAPRLTPAQRDALDASRNIVLRAGAGSGKTTVLAHRYVRLLELGLVGGEATESGRGENRPLLPAEILTLTFTKKAAAEMRERIARFIAERLAAARTDDERTTWRAHRDALDQAPIETIHAFCRQTLEEFSLRAGLDPAFDLAEEFVLRQLRADAIDAALADAGEEDAPDDDRRALGWLARTWERTEVVETIEFLRRHHDTAEAVRAALPHPGAGGWEEWMLRDAADDLARVEAAVRAGGAVATFADALAAMFRAAGGDVPPESKARRFLDAARRARDAAATGRQLDLIAAAGEVATLPLTGKGAPYVKSGWFSHFYGVKKSEPAGKRLAAAENDLYAGAMPAILALKESVDRLPGRGDLELAPDLDALFTLAARAGERLRDALAERHLLTQDDLIVLTRDLLRDHPEVRAALRARFRHIMVDEFQDTDPVQWEIIRLLASVDASARSGGDLGGGEDAPGAPLLPARLFLVGDEKQSIYRFRGADVAVFAAAREAVAAPASGGRIVSMGENFRSRPRLLAALNRLFAHVFAWDEVAAGARPPYAAEPQELIPGEYAIAHGGDGASPAPPTLDAWIESLDDPATVAVALYKPYKVSDDDAEGGDGTHASADDADGAGEPDADAAWDALDGLSPGDAAARAVRHVLGATAGGAPLPVRDPASPGGWRPAVADDVMLLMQATTHLPSVERALRFAGIPYTVEAGKGFFQTQEVYDLRNALAFLADTRDDVALAGVLRGPLVSLPDDALTAIALRDGATWWERLRDLASSAGAAESAALREAEALLARWLELAPHLALADHVQTIAEESGALAAFAQGRGGPQRLANLEKLADLARTFERAGLRGARAFVEHLDAMGEDESLREGQADVAEAGSGVRIATVHGAKGREAPIVLLADADRKSRADSGRFCILREQRMPHEGGGVRHDLAPGPPGWLKEGDYRRRDALREAVAQRDDAEARRLYYVAATRARDHLLLVARAEAATNRRWMHWLFEWTGGKSAERTAWLRASLLSGAWASPPEALPPHLRGITCVALHGDAFERPGTDRLASFVAPRTALSPSTGSAPSTPPIESRSPSAAAALAADLDALHDIAPSAAWRLDTDPAGYYREVVLGVAEPSALSVKKPARSLTAAEKGTLVHRAFLEGVSGAEACHALVHREAAGFGLYRDDDVARREIDSAAKLVAESVERFAGSELGCRLTAWRGALRREESIALRLGRLRFGGRIDLLAVPAAESASVSAAESAANPAERALLIDFKTSRVDGDGGGAPVDAAALARHADANGYFVQLGLYALALAPVAGIGPPDLVVYYTRYGLHVARPWTAADADALRARAAAWERRVADGAFSFAVPPPPAPWPAPPDPTAASA